MKQFCKTVLFTCLFCSSLLMRGQEETYHEFAPIGATWHYTLYEAENGGFGFIQITATKDTLIQGKRCSQLQQQVTYSNQNTRIINSIHVYYEMGKVYSFIKGNFYLLYDFTAKKGDYWQTRIPFEFNNISAIAGEDTMMIMYVNDISTEIIDGEDYRSLDIDISCNEGNCRWEICNNIIEKIGNIECFLFPEIRGVGHFDLPFGIRCYEDEELQMQWETPCEIIFTNVPTDNTILTINVFPNPAHEVLYLQLSETTTGMHTPVQVTIYDSHGSRQWQQSQKLTPDKLLPLDISTLPKGMYWLSIEHPQISYSTKILKL